jgi:hypothetical protein
MATAREAAEFVRESLRENIWGNPFANDVSRIGDVGTATVAGTEWNGLVIFTQHDERFLVCIRKVRREEY